MKRRKYFIVTLLLLIIVISCKKRPTYYMDQEFKDYIVFPAGSYWVYEDSLGKKKDTIQLNMQSIKIYDDPDKANFKYESLSQKFTSTDSMHSSYTFSGWVEPDDFNSYICSCGGVIFFSRELIGTEKNYVNGRNGTIYLQQYSSLDINNINYKNVKVFQTDDFSIGKKIYWSKKVGIVKKEMADGTTWLLKEYHINN